MRAGADYFVTPAEPAQRRYEALRSYFVDDASAAEVGSRFGYSPATVHQLAAELRAGRTQFFLSSKPGPRGPRKSGRVRDQVLALRAEDRSVTDIAERVSMDGTPVSAQSVWAILHAEGIERLGRSHAGPSPRLGPVKAAPIGDWPAGAVFDCDHAGLYVLLPALVELGIDALVAGAAYPGTKVLSPFHSLASLLLVKCSRRGRAANAFPLGAGPGLGLAVGLSAVPKATHLTSYSYRARRSCNVALLESLARRCRELGLYSGEAGFNLDFHSIRHHGAEVPLEEHYVASRSQRTRSVLTFFAQDHASTEMVYANADLTKADQANEVIAFADYWARVAGTDPALLVFDSKVTTYKTLDELAARGITFLTLRQRGQKVLEALAALPSSAWTTYNLRRPGRYRHPQIHEEIIHLKGIEIPLRQIAVRNIGHRAPHLAHHQRPRNRRQGPLRPLRRADDHRERARRRYLRVPPQRPRLGAPPQRRLGHHPHRPRRQRLPTPRPQAPPLRASHPRPALAPLPRQHRQGRCQPRPRPSRPRRADLHPGAHRRRLPRARPTRPLVGWTNAPLRLPATVNLNPTI